MNVIVNGNVHEGTKLYTGENGHLFLDDKDLGEVAEHKFQARTINGEVYLAQWEVVNGGANV
ncbi:MAG: hypothetical protein ACTSX1_11335 [Candidatus Heimdallarchaeaceae archaeon]